MEEPILDQTSRQNFPANFNQPQTGWWAWVMNHKWLLIAGFLLVILLAVASLWFFRNQKNAVPETPNVVLSIKGSETLAAGNETEYRIIYTNGENDDMINITLEAFYPSNFQFVSAEPKAASSNGQRFDLPILRQGQSAEVKIRGKLTGATGESKDLRGKLTYSLTNFTSEFSVEASFKTVLTAPALEMEITGPIDVTNGQSSSFTVNYKNVSNKEYEAIAVHLVYPEGFKFLSSVPGPSKDNNIWNLGALPLSGSGKIEISGSFMGESATEQQVEGDLGLVVGNSFAPQIHASARFKIQASTLSVMQEVIPPSVVSLGQTLQYSLKYANYGATGQSNVVITATVDGASIDVPKIKASNGIVTGNTITWKSATWANLSLLSPNQKGEVQFTVPLKPTVSTNLKNQTVVSNTTIYSDQITSPVRGEEKVIKLASELQMIVSGSYVSGAMPMKVGESTVFEITFLLTNLGNDVKDAELIASMPLPAQSWASIVVPESEKSKVSFDQNASKIRWKVGDIPAFVGKFSPAKIATVQLKVTPSESDRGKVMVLLKDIQASGTDTFTELELLSTKLSQLGVAELNDDTVDSKGSSVQ